MTAAVAILNQKGGVGKTTLTLGLASAAWAQGLSVLVVDLDAQANATWVLGVEPALDYLSSADAIDSGVAGAAGEMIIESGWGHLVWLLPASSDLAKRDGGPSSGENRRSLAVALDGIVDEFDLVLFDCPPSLGLNPTRALVAATEALIVVEPSDFGLRGVDPVLGLIKQVWSAENPALGLSGVVFNRVPAISAGAQARIHDLQTRLGPQTVWDQSVPQRVLINQAHHERSPIHTFGREAVDITVVFDRLLIRLLGTTR